MQDQKTGSPTPHPIHPTHLPGSKWSSVDEALEFCHWEVSSYSKKKGVVTLFATLDRDTTLTIPWRELRERERWEPGWR